MAQCPVCDTEYTENEVETCTVCGYDLTPYPPVLGEIPSGFLEKERKRLAAAKRVWQISQSRLQSTELIVSRFQSQLDGMTRQIEQLTEFAESQHQHQANFQSQLDNMVEKIDRLNPGSDRRLLLNLKTQLDEICGQISGLTEAVNSNRRPVQAGYVFEVVKVNEKGKEISRRPGQAECIVEDLGDGVTLEMVLIPGGTFMMGSQEDYDSERPQHRVTIQPFLMGKYPITQAQWRRVANLPKLQRDLDPDPAIFKENNRPIEQVSWYDAIEFCARLAKATQKPYRLPSEAQWEYACRAGTTTPFHFGKTLSTDIANYDGNYTYGSGVKGVYRKETTPVGQFKVANAFGLYDMHGNVWEWCADPWHDNYNGAPSDGRVWDENDNDYQNYGVDNLVNFLNTKKERVLRGGSWYYNPDGCRCAFRSRDSPVSLLNYHGFRVSCPPPETLSP